MHFLSPRNRSEFLAVPQLVRFGFADERLGSGSAVILKSTSLILKYLLIKRRFRIVFAALDRGYLGYGIEVEDDTSFPALHWSLVGHQDELDALMNFANTPSFFIHAFNELAINVFWGEVELDELSVDLINVIKSTRLHPVEDLKAIDEMHKVAKGIFFERISPPIGFRLDSPSDVLWHELQNNYVTNRLETVSVSLFDLDEGGQQEELALWLIDNLDPLGAIRGPQVCEPGKNLANFRIFFLHMSMDHSSSSRKR